VAATGQTPYDFGNGLDRSPLLLTIQSENIILISCIHVQILRCTRKYQILDMSARMEDSHYSGQAVTLWGAITGLPINDRINGGT
jgi:hypothetical protein